MPFVECAEVVCLLAYIYWVLGMRYASLGVFIPTWGNDPISLEFFKWVETTELVLVAITLKLTPRQSANTCGSIL